MVVVKLKENKDLKDIEVLIQYEHMDQRVRRLEHLTKSVDYSLKCSLDGEIKWINITSILYIESVSKKTFVYSKNEVLQTELRLYQILEQFESAGLAQVSKFCLVNLYHLKSIRTLINSRMEGMLINGERITVSRKYIPEIKMKLTER